MCGIKKINAKFSTVSIEISVILSFHNYTCLLKIQLSADGKKLLDNVITLTNKNTFDLFTPRCA